MYMANPSRPWLQSSSYFYFYYYFYLPTLHSFLPIKLIQLLALPHLTKIKPAGTNISLVSTPTNHIFQALLHSLFQYSHLHKLLNYVATSTIPFGNINLPAKTWWSPEIAEAVAKRRKAFARAHCSEKECQNYISISRYLNCRKFAPA